MRDPNLRMLMGALGGDSPMFDYVEQIAGRPTPSSVGSKATANQKMTKERLQLEREANKLKGEDALEKVE